MRLHNSTTARRGTFVANLTERARQRRLASMFTDPDLTPAARQELMAVLLRGQGERHAVPATARNAA